MLGTVLAAYAGTVLLGAIIAFFCGSIPFSLIIGKRVAGIDIRQRGSGNVGATNVARSLGKGPGLAAFLCDVLKGAVGVGVMMGLLAVSSDLFLGQNIAGVSLYTFGFYYDLALVIAAAAAVLGHVFSPFLGFHGGKGVSTTLGALLVVMPLTALTAFALFIVIVLATRYVSLGSISAACSLPLWSWLFYRNSIVFLVCCICIAVVLVVAHRANISRLIHHKESKFTFGS